MTDRAVVMPPKAPYGVILELAGNPLILAASDEIAYRKIYKAIRTALLNDSKWIKQRKRK